jgi:hypothetical protein
MTIRRAGEGHIAVPAPIVVARQRFICQPEAKRSGIPAMTATRPVGGSVFLVEDEV